jgi:hypothetical protein
MVCCVDSLIASYTPFPFYGPRVSGSACGIEGNYVSLVTFLDSLHHTTHLLDWLVAVGWCSS